MVFGIMIMALPVSILTQNFAEYEDNIYHHVIHADEDEYDENAVRGSGSFSSHTLLWLQANSIFEGCCLSCLSGT